MSIAASCVPFNSLDPNPPEVMPSVAQAEQTRSGVAVHSAPARKDPPAPDAIPHSDAVLCQLGS